MEHNVLVLEFLDKIDKSDVFGKQAQVHQWTDLWCIWKRGPWPRESTLGKSIKDRRLSWVQRQNRCMLSFKSWPKSSTSTAGHANFLFFWKDDPSKWPDEHSNSQRCVSFQILQIFFMNFNMLLNSLSFMSNISLILWKFKPTQDVKQLCVMEALPPFVDSLLYSRLYLLTHVLCYVQTYTHVCMCFSNLLEPFPNILKILWYFSLGNLLENSQQKFTHFTVALLY